MTVRVPRRKVLPLTNSGALSLYPVGCGSAFSRTLSQNNYLIVKGDDHCMVDCGTRTPETLARVGVPVTRIDNWIITHSHADHVGGLEEVMLMSRYVERRKPNMIITSEYEHVLWNSSLKGGCESNESRDGVGLQFGDFWTVVRPTWLQGYPRETHHIRIGSIDIKAVRTLHYPEQASDWSQSAFSVGLIIDDRILFSGDTQFDAELLIGYDDLFHFECIFHDVQFYTGGIHASLDELETLPDSLKSRMILMHYPDAFEEHRQQVKRAGFRGFVRQGAFYTFD
jgi:ribonuclease BN (tRNA processing enzyme)